MPHALNRCGYTVIALKIETTPSIVRELLHYDPDTGIFTWQNRNSRWFEHERARKMWHTRYFGKRAGRVVTREGGYQYRVIRMLGKPRLEHRLAWLYMDDNPPPPEIDHKNRIGTDNRWCNLRASTHVDNCHNLSMKHNNRSGFTGVDWHKASCSWRARCWADGKRHCLGYFKNVHDANDAVTRFRANHGYDPDHGASVAHYHRN